MYCNDWSDDAQDSSWWLPVAFVTAVRAPVLERVCALHASWAPHPRASAPTIYKTGTPRATTRRHRPAQDAPGKVQWHAFNTCDTSLPIAAPAGGGHVIVNAGRTGFYRVGRRRRRGGAGPLASAAALRRLLAGPGAARLQDARACFSWVDVFTSHTPPTFIMYINRP